MELACILGLDKSHLVYSYLLKCHVHKAVQKSLEGIYYAAQKEGFDFKLVSGYRTFERQLSIWNRKFSGELPLYDRSSRLLDRSQMNDYATVFAILNWSAIPGFSRHHWGTDFDVAIDTPEYSEPKLIQAEYDVGGPYYSFWQWLHREAPNYGFIFPYAVESVTGVCREPWHISYEIVASKAQALITIEVIQSFVEQQAIFGKKVILDHCQQIFNEYIQHS